MRLDRTVRAPWSASSGDHLKFGVVWPAPSRSSALSHPPDSWCELVEPLFGCRDGYPPQHMSARARALAGADRPCGGAPRLGDLCPPMRRAGLSEVIGSWKIIACARRGSGAQLRSAHCQQVFAGQSRAVPAVTRSVGVCSMAPSAPSDVRLLPTAFSAMHSVFARREGGSSRIDSCWSMPRARNVSPRRSRMVRTQLVPTPSRGSVRVPLSATRCARHRGALRLVAGVIA